MAKANGPIRISGKIGDLVFYIRNGEQYVKLASDMKGKRMKKYGKKDKRNITNAIRLGINYYATSLYRLMKVSGLNPGQQQFNTFKNEIYYKMLSKIKLGETIKATDVKQVIHGFEWRNNEHGSQICAVQVGDVIRINNISNEARQLSSSKKYQINIYRITLNDVLWNGEKYTYTLPGIIPIYTQEEWTCTPSTLFYEIAVDDVADHEFVVMSVLPLLDEHYPMQSGASVWVF